MNEIKAITDKVVSALQNVPGIEGVVLGGSRARGTHTPDSDIDIGIYYDNATLDIAALNDAAQAVDDEHRVNLISRPGQWGNWVNGGGWLVIDGYHVDFILRDTARVKKEIEECQGGNVSAHYQTGHPHAYINAMYMGELAVCKVLWDNGDIAKLKQTVEKYPSSLKKALVGFFSFEAGFSLMFAENNVDKDDSYYVTAHIVRAVSALNQVLFALNEEYCLNEKKAVKMIDCFALKPESYKNRIDAVFASAGVDNRKACALLRGLADDVGALSKGMSHLEDVDIENALRTIADIIERAEKAQSKFAAGTSQHSLQENRIHALRVAQALVLQLSGDVQLGFTCADLERAKSPLASLISKLEKAQTKLKEDCWQHKMLRDNLAALHLAAELLTARISEEAQ